MIETMQGLALKIYPVRYLVVGIGGIALACFVYIVLSGEAHLDDYLLPLVSIFGWCVSLYGIATTFQNAPPEILENDRFFTRIKKRISRFISWFWSVAFCLVTVLMFYLSYKTFSMSLAGGS